MIRDNTVGQCNVNNSCQRDKTAAHAVYMYNFS